MINDMWSRYPELEGLNQCQIELSRRMGKWRHLPGISEGCRYDRLKKRAHRQRKAAHWRRLSRRRRAKLSVLGLTLKMEEGGWPEKRRLLPPLSATNTGNAYEANDWAGARHRSISSWLTKRRDRTCRPLPLAAQVPGWPAHFSPGPGGRNLKAVAGMYRR